MGTVKVSYANRLPEITGRVSETVEFPTPLSLRDFIHHLVERYGKAFEKEVNLKTFEWGQESFLYQFFVDGNKIPEMKKDDLLIHHQSEVSILPILGGG
jgi:molybdopterin converting factor small subunit